MLRALCSLAVYLALSCCWCSHHWNNNLVVLLITSGASLRCFNDVCIEQRILFCVQESNNGFVIAKANMLNRGAGQLLGQRQSGPADLGLGSMLSMTDLCIDEPTMIEARQCAVEMIKNENGLRGLPRSMIAGIEAYHMTSLLKFAMQDVDMHIT